MLFRTCRAASLAACIAVWPLPTAGQLTITVAIGTTPAAGVELRLVNTSTGATTLLTTSASGSATTPELVEGAYRVESAAPYVRDGATYRWNYPVRVEATTPPIALTEAEAIVDTGSRPRKVTFGLSVGARVRLGDEADRLRSAVVQYPDTVIKVDTTDRSDLILSGVATAFPFGGWGHWFGFTANINLADLGSGSLSLNNKSVEGGLGIAVKASDDLAIGLTWERIFSRRLHEHIVERGYDVTESGRRVTNLNIDDPDIFVQDNQHGMAVHLIFRF